MKNLGFNPEMIIDVGAYRGEFTDLCMELWGKKPIICCEPLASRVSELKTKYHAEKNIQIIDGLVGATNHDNVVLNESETASSVLHEHFDQGFATSQHQMRTIDTILKSTGTKPTQILLKIDVQGYELEVLKGAIETLGHVDAILMEINVLDIHVNAPLLHDVVAWLSQRNFVTYDISGITRRPHDYALWQLDLIFIPLNSKLRNNKQWA
ncbi:MAG: FkbM family methyltransferase [Gammaproteobacteria bacterium]|nr:FkbM family methyltransferase [Gammaproteobacteria bacterium]MDH5730459.1 FkbM family methyltransferase [Gammaproteobacteria bacterium]